MDRELWGEAMKGAILALLFLTLCWGAQAAQVDPVGLGLGIGAQAVRPGHDRIGLRDAGGQVLQGAGDDYIKFAWRQLASGGCGDSAATCQRPLGQIGKAG